MSEPHSQGRRLLVGSPSAQMRSYVTVQLISVATFVAMLAPLSVMSVRYGAAWVQLLIVSVLIVIFWQAVFALSRRRAMSVDGITVGLAFALIAGPSTPLWQAALSVSFGIVFGEQLFGGRGHSFLNPAVIALAFLLFSFPDAVAGESNQAMALAVLPGALLLIATGIVSWRIVAGALAGLVASALAFGAADPLAGLTVGGFAFGLVFFACDPVASASTNPGRWLYGILFGALAISLADGTQAPSSRSVVFAALLASVLAPLIDQAIIWINARRRRRRYG